MDIKMMMMMMKMIMMMMMDYFDTFIKTKIEITKIDYCERDKENFDCLSGRYKRGKRLAPSSV